MFSVCGRSQWVVTFNFNVRAGLGDEALRDLGTLMPSPAPAACAEVLRWLQRDNVCLVPHPDGVWQMAAHTPLGSVPQRAPLLR